MEYREKKLGSYKLHMIKTNKFKTIRVKVFFLAPVKKEEITMRNFLSSILATSNAEYKTKREFLIKKEDLYSASISSSTTRFGNYNCLNFTLNTLEDKYTEEGNLEKSIKLFSDSIYKPNIENGKFDTVYFDTIRKRVATNFEGIKEDTAYYSTIRLLEEIDSSSPLSYRSYGYKEDLEKITPSNLVSYYEKILNNDIMDIFVIGNIDFNEIEELIKRYFPVKIFKKSGLPARIDEFKRNSVKVVKEKIDTNQSKLAIGFSLNKLEDYERNYPLTLFSIILGGGTNSKLFRNVREKNSLCYYIYSTVNKLDNLLMVRAGISKENYDEVVKLTKKELLSIKKGNIDEVDIENAKMMYISSIDELEESQDDLIDCYYMIDLIGVDLGDLRIIKKMEVTKEDIIRVSKKVHLNTIYLLEGEKDEEN